MTWAMRSGRMPETHLGADTVVRLSEHAVQRRAITPFEDLPGLVALDAAHAGAQHVAVGQHHFHAALHQEVFAIRRVAHAPVHGVADRTGNAGGRRKRQHQRQFVVFDVVVQLLVGHARLDQRGAKLRVNMDDLVHQPQVQHDLTALAGRGRAIAKIATGRDGPDRHFVGVANLQDRLDFFHRLGEQNGCRGMLLVFDGHHDLVVRDEAFGAGLHTVSIEDFAEFLQCRIKTFFGHALGQHRIFGISHS